MAQDLYKAGKKDLSMSEVANIGDDEALAVKERLDYLWAEKDKQEALMSSLREPKIRIEHKKDKYGVLRLTLYSGNDGVISHWQFLENHDIWAAHKMIEDLLAKTGYRKTGSSSRQINTKEEVLIEDWIDILEPWNRFLAEHPDRKEVFAKADLSQIKHPLCLTSPDPFKEDWPAVAKFTELEDDIFHLRGQFLHKHEISEQLGPSYWIIIVKGEVVVRVDSLDDMATTEWSELRKIGKQHNGFPFAFAKTVEIG